MPSDTLEMEEPYHTNKPRRKSQFRDCTSWRFILIGSLMYSLSWEGRPGGSSRRLSTIIVSMVRKQAENEQEVVWSYRTPRFTPNDPLVSSEAPPCKGATIFFNRTNWGPTVQTRDPLCSKHTTLWLSRCLRNWVFQCIRITWKEMVLNMSDIVLQNI